MAENNHQEQSTDTAAAGDVPSPAVEAYVRTMLERIRRRRRQRREYEYQEQQRVVIINDFGQNMDVPTLNSTQQSGEQYYYSPLIYLDNCASHNKDPPDNRTGNLIKKERDERSK